MAATSTKKGTRSARKARAKVNIVDRRRRLSLLLRSQPDLTQKEIAAALGVSEATVSSDKTALLAEWQAETRLDIQRMMQQDAAALDGDELMFRRMMDEAPTEAARTRLYEVILSIYRRRATLVGLDSVLRRQEGKGSGGALASMLDALLASGETP